MSGARLTLPALLGAMLLASGCASGDYAVRNDPPQPPAADNAAAIDRMQALEALQAARVETPATPLDESKLGPPLTAADAPSMQTYDPWERMNRFTYRFNTRFDEAVFLPVANTYRRLPAPVRSGVHNFISNLTEVISTLNYAAQLRPAQGVRSSRPIPSVESPGAGRCFGSRITPVPAYRSPS